MTAERYHENKATSFESKMLQLALVPLLLLTIWAGFQFGYIQHIADWVAFHWQTIWQVLVVGLLLSLANKNA